MITEFILKESVAGAEMPEDLDKNDDTVHEGCLISQKQLSEYIDTASRVLTQAEAEFPFFAQDTGCTVSVYFIDNESIHEINREQRGVDRATDVLSFPFLELREGDGEFSEYDMNPENGAIMLGEILVSVEKVAEQAEEYGHSKERELAFLVCHGFLHLMGFDHMEPEEEKRMMGKAEEILGKLGITRD